MIVFYLLMAIPFVPFMARGWYSYSMIVLPIAGFLAWVWIDYALSPPNYSGPGDAFGLIPFSERMSLFFVGTALARAFGIVMESRGWTKRKIFLFDLAVGVLLAASIAAYLFLPRLIHDYRMRPPPAACLARDFQVLVGDRVLRVPHHEALSVYLRPDTRSGGHNLFFPPAQRSLCRLTEQATEIVEAAAVSINFHDHYRYLRHCNGERHFHWEAEICREQDRANLRGFPVEFHIFRAEGVRLGYFGIGPRTFEQFSEMSSSNGMPRRNGPLRYLWENDRRQHFGFLVLEERPTPFADSTIAVCRFNPGSTSIYCDSRQRISHKTDLYYAFTTTLSEAQADFEAAQQRVDEIVLSLEPVR